MQHDPQPATQDDLERLRQSLEGRMERQAERLESCEQEIIQHFDLVAENLRHDLLGAHRDEIEILKDARNDHERRISQLERSTGVLIG